MIRSRGDMFCCDRCGKWFDDGWLEVYDDDKPEFDGMVEEFKHQLTAEDVEKMTFTTDGFVYVCGRCGEVHLECQVDESDRPLQRVMF